MNINESLGLPLELWGHIFKQVDGPLLPLSCVSKSLYAIFSQVAFEVYRDHPSLKEIACHIEWVIEKENGSSTFQEKIKALYHKYRFGWISANNKNIQYCGVIRRCFLDRSID